MIIDASGFEFEQTPWTAHAACAGTNPDLWFPDRGSSGVAEAKAICAQCTVRRECLTYALRWRIEHGIWGGLSHRERLRRGYSTVRRPRRLPASHGTTTRYARGCRCQDCRNANQAYAETRRSSA